ncbi:hypothetical protein GC163_19120 [bacterium]|nr:hypothetical protein [bacterium]
MSEPDPKPQITTQPCPLCGQELPFSTETCPHCGEAVKPDTVVAKLSQFPPPAQPGDVICAVIIGLISIGLTVPWTVMSAIQVWNNVPYAEIGLIIFLPWGTWLLGLPTATVLWHWYHNAYRGQMETTYLWRTYWKAQFLTYGLTVPLGLLLFCICASM